MRSTGGALLLLLGTWSLLVGSCTVLDAGAGNRGVLISDSLIALAGLLCIVAAPFYFMNRGRLFALGAPLVAIAAEGLSQLLVQPSWIGLAKILLLLLALLAGLGIGNNKHLPGGA